MKKIVYSAGKHLGAGFQLSDLLSNCSFEIKTSAYAENTRHISKIDWTLNALNTNQISYKDLKNFFNTSEYPDVSLKEVDILYQEIKQFDPDLIICDGEPIVSHLAIKLEIPLWYCSSLHLLDGIKWKYGQFLKYSEPLSVTRRFLRKLPPAEYILVYSPFGDLENPPPLRSEFEWIQPYTNNSSSPICDVSRQSILTKILEASNIKKYNDWIFCDGHTKDVTNALYDSKSLCISPNIKDSETILNAALCSSYQLGIDVGQVELLGYLGPEIIEKAYKDRYKQKNIIKRNKKLHERILL